MKVSFTGNGSKAPDVNNGVKVPYGAAKRRPQTLRWVAVLLVLTSPIIYLAGRIVLEQVSPSSYGVVYANKYTVNVGAAGFVEEVYFKEGDSVAEGDDLMLVQNEPQYGMQAEEPYAVKSPCSGRISSITVCAGEHYLAAAPLGVVVGDDDICILAYAEAKNIKNALPGAQVEVKLSSTKRSVSCEVVSYMTEVSPFETHNKNSFLESDSLGARVFLKINDDLTPEERIDGLPVQVFWS